MTIDYWRGIAERYEAQLEEARAEIERLKFADKRAKHHEEEAGRWQDAAEASDRARWAAEAERLWFVSDVEYPEHGSVVVAAATAEEAKTIALLADVLTDNVENLSASRVTADDVHRLLLDEDQAEVLRKAGLSP